MVKAMDEPLDTLIIDHIPALKASRDCWWGVFEARLSIPYITIEREKPGTIIHGQQNRLINPGMLSPRGNFRPQISGVSCA